jgi:hypothetical protein
LFHVVAPCTGVLAIETELSNTVYFNLLMLYMLLLARRLVELLWRRLRLRGPSFKH